MSRSAAGHMTISDERPEGLTYGAVSTIRNDGCCKSPCQERSCEFFSATL